MQSEPNIPPPLIPAKPIGKSWPEGPLSILLSLCLGLFLTDAVISLVDDSLILFLDVHILAVFRGLLFLLMLLMSLLVYVLMGLTPMIPKRWFFPVTLFYPVAGFLVIPFAIYSFGRMQEVSWVISFCQLVVGLLILGWIRGGIKIRWPLFQANQLGHRRFSWLNLSAFILINIFVLLPVTMAYFAICSSLAVAHFSDGFLALRPAGLTVQVRKYVRDDGKTIQLVPMAHVGDSAFYQNISQSFPSNAIVLMEGVTDSQNLLTNKITYKRMATSLGLSEQREEFRPQGEMVQADIDVDQFSPDTIQLLNMIMLVHAKGMNEQTLLQFSKYSPPVHFEKQLFDDLLRKRNRHLLAEIHSWLPRTDDIIVPWGAAHIPELARAIQKDGFRLKEASDFTVIQFGSAENKSKRSEKQRSRKKSAAISKKP